MKINLKKILIAVVIVTAPLFMLAQTPPHPNGGNNPGAGNGPVGGGAGVGSGIFILTAMGVAYGVLKYYQKQNETPISD